MRRLHFAWPLALACVGAHAQSSVTLYGIVDIGLTYTNNAQTAVGPGQKPVGGSQVALNDAQAGLSPSRFGLRGVEDLGGGLSALFVLENGFLANTGGLAQGGALFGRQAYVGLSSTTFGTVTFGRQWDPYVDAIAPQSSAATVTAFIGTHPDDVDNLVVNRANNAIKFRSADYRGFSAEAMYAPGGVAGDFTANQIWGLAARYTGGGFSFAAGYVNARDPNVSFYGNIPGKGVATANNLGSFGSANSAEVNPVYAGYASAATTEIGGLAASYTYRALTVGALLTQARFDHLGATAAPNPLAYTGNANFTTIELNVRDFLTPTLQVGGAVAYTSRNSVNGDGGADYLQFGAGVDYLLSRRTDVYGIGIFQRANGTDSLGRSAVASISGFSPSATSRQVGVRLGLRHRF